MNNKFLGTSPETIIPKLQSLLVDLEGLAYSDLAAGIDEAVVIRKCILASRKVPCLMGEMIGHPKLADGRPAVTSELFYLDRKRRLGRTLSRWYHFDEGLLDI
jgi:hypothetical protein